MDRIQYNIETYGIMVRYERNVTMMEQYIEVLRNTFLWKGLTDDEFQYFLSKAKVQMKKIKKNAFIFREMERPEKLFLLVK